jgi:hypothetical protein
MKKRIWTGTCAAIVVGLTAGLLAQENPQTQQPSQTSRSSAKAITVTGCIQQVEKGAAGTSGATGAPASSKANEPKFLLTNAALSTEASGATAGTSGAAPSATSVASEYRLDGDDAKLSPHVGHKVEISGTVAKVSKASGPTEAPAASAANAPKLKVNSVRMVSSSCP